jgi:hypothetical protein
MNIKQPGIKKYSVLLSYPGYITDGDQQSYYTHTEATDRDGAVKAARQEAYEANKDYIDDPNDFAEILVIEGYCPAI